MFASALAEGSLPTQSSVFHQVSDSCFGIGHELKNRVPLEPNQRSGICATFHAVDSEGVDSDGRVKRGIGSRTPH